MALGVSDEPKAKGERRKALTVAERASKFDRSIAAHEAAIVKLKARKSDLAKAARDKAAQLLSEAGIGVDPGTLRLPGEGSRTVMVDVEDAGATSGSG
jgi:hypothetical protein